MKRLALLFCAIFLLSPAWEAPAKGSNWEFLPAMHTVRELIRLENVLWGATNSGLFRFDLETETFQNFTIVEGLSSNDIQTMAYSEERNELILGMGNAYVDIFNIATQQVTHVPYFNLASDIFSIYALYNCNDTIYVATDVGVHRMLYFAEDNKYLVTDTYQNLGVFPQKTRVNAIEIFNGGLWVGTPIGIARGNLSSLYLESPQYWQNYTTSQGLSDNDIAALEIFQGSLYAAAPDSGLNVLIDESTGFVPLNLLYDSGIIYLKAHQGILYLGRRYGIFRLEGNQTVGYGPQNARGRCVEFEEDGTMWGGFQTDRTSSNVTIFGGLKRWTGADWITYAIDGPLVEMVSDIFVESDGTVWVTGMMILGYGGPPYTNGCLCRFDGTHWVNLGPQSEDYVNNNFVSPNNFFGHETVRLTRDYQGGIWVASYGRGLAWFEDQVDTVLVKGFFDATTGHLQQIYAPGDPNTIYCVVQDLLTDDWGNVWACNSYADTSYGHIAIIPSDFINNPQSYPNWSYLTVRELNGTPITNGDNIDRLEQDFYGRKWFGAFQGATGVRILDDGGTISPNNDIWWTIPELASMKINAIATDRDGIVWVGTNEGVKYFYPDPNPDFLSGYSVYVPVDQIINTIAVDPQNNKWFGTNHGLSILSSDNYTWLDSYTSFEGEFPSPLPADEITAIAFDARTGDAYIGTSAGLVRLSTPYQQMGPTVTYVAVNQNPFKIDEGSIEPLRISAGGISETTELKIFSTAGFLVRHLSSNEWDGRNSKGELVGSGIYFILAYAPDGSSALGKVAVIHQ